MHLDGLQSHKRRAARFVLAVLAAGCLSGCAPHAQREGLGSTWVPEAPGKLVSLPAPDASTASRPSIAIPEGVTPEKPLTLVQILDYALRTSPRTRAAYERVVTEAQEVGVQRSAFWPSLDLTASATRLSQSALGGRFSLAQTLYGPAVGLQLLLIDFGGRRGDLDEARASLLAASYRNNDAIQDLVLYVEEAYYGYLDAKAQLVAARQTLEEAQLGLDVAERRHEAGLATIADVLQARTLRSQMRLNVQAIEGQIMSLRGALATAVGAPANTPFDVGDLPEVVPSGEIAQEVETLIESAMANRADLAAARARVEALRGRIESARGEGLPTLSLSGSASRTYYDPSTYADFGDNGSVALLFRFPLFTGFETVHKLRKAESETRTAEAEAQDLEQQAVLEVWTSYYDLRTATVKLATARDLLESADASGKVALGRYREGVGSLLDLLTAQSLLARARAEEIRARTDWFLATARLARATGSLVPPAADRSGETDSAP